MNRRAFLAWAATLAALTSRAQGPKAFRIGVLLSNSTGVSKKRMDGFVQGLAEHGMVDGRNVQLVVRSAEDDAKALPRLAAELAAMQVDVIFAPTTVAALAAQKATGTIPIVFAAPPDPVASGLVKSLAHPGGNATGTSSVATAISAKRLQILKEAFPKASRVAVFTSPEAIVAKHLSEIEHAAKTMGMAVLPVQVLSAADVEKTVTTLRDWRADSACMVQSSTNLGNRKLLADVALRARLPSIVPNEDYLEAGGLISYGADFVALHARAAAFVERIRRGAKPAELPVEQPAVFELVINMRVAKALDLVLPPALLMRAAKLVE